MAKVKNIFLSIFRWLVYTLLGILLLFVLLVFAVRTPKVQNWITRQATSYVHERTGAQFEIEKIYLSFKGGLEIQSLFLADPQYDTIALIDHLELSVAVMPIFNNHIQVSELDLSGAHLKLSRSNSGAYNYSFLIDAFSSQETSLDTTQKSTDKNYPRIHSGPIRLTNCSFVFNDSLHGISLNSNLDLLRILPNELDLEEMNFSVKDLELSGSNTTLRIDSSLATSSESGEISLPEIAWNRLQIQNTSFKYDDLQRQETLETSLSNLEFAESKIVLQDSALELGMLKMDDLDFMYLAAVSETPGESQDSINFSLPDYKLSINGIELNSRKVIYHLGEEQPADHFDPNHLILHDLSLKLGRSQYDPELIEIDLKELSTVLNDKFQMHHLGFKAELHPDKLHLDAFTLQTTGTSLDSDILMQFGSMNQLVQGNPGDFSLALDKNIIDLNDLLFFQPDLDTIDLFHAFSSNPIYASGKVFGSRSSLNLEGIEIAALNNSSLQLNGSVSNPTNTSLLQTSLKHLKLQTDIEDISILIDTTGLILPSRLSITGSLEGDMNQADSRLQILSDLVDVDGEVRLGQSSDSLVYEGDLNISRIDLNHILQRDDFDTVQAHLSFDGSGATLEDLQADLKVAFEHLIFKNYDYENLRFEAAIDHGKLQAALAHKGDALVMNSSINGTLDSTSNELKIKLDVAGANLGELGLSSQNIKMGFGLHAALNQRSDALDLEIFLNKLLIINGSESYRIDSSHVMVHNAPEASGVDLFTPFLDAEILSNTSLQDLPNALRYHLGLSIDTSTYTPKLTRKFELNSEALIYPDPIVTELLLPGIREMDTVVFKAHFTPDSRELDALLRIPEFIYGERGIQGLELSAKSSRDTSRLQLQFSNVKGPYLDIDSTELFFNRQRNKGRAGLKVWDKQGEKDFMLLSELDIGEIQKSIKFLSDSLILNHEKWTVDPDNLISWGEGLNVDQLQFSNGKQGFQVQSEESGKLLISFSDFDLKVIFGLLNNEKDLLAGRLNGNIEFLQLEPSPEFVADLGISTLSVSEAELGDLKLFVAKKDLHNYDIDLKVNGPHLELLTLGKYRVESSDPQLDLKLNLNRFETSVLSSIIPQYVDSAFGVVKADLEIAGPTSDPQYKGALHFVNAGFLPQATGTLIRLEDEKISIDEKGLYIANLEIKDPTGRSIDINGSVFRDRSRKDQFDLDLKAKRFQLMSSQQGENELYYGKVLADLDISIKGNLKLPVIRSEVVLRDETNFTYIVPASQAQMENSASLVVFEDMKDTLKILKTEPAQSRLVRGFDLESRVILKNGTQLNMILDPRSGDNMSITGAADLHYTLTPNGISSLTGQYELNDGGYKLNLYDLVKKEFRIKPQSEINWTGNPEDASLNITAIYSTKTSAASLMDDPDPRFNRSLPFEVHSVP